MPDTERIKARSQADPQDAQRAISETFLYPYSANLRFPTRLHIFASELSLKPENVTADAIRAGSLLSEGHVFQLVGGIPPIQLSLANFDPYPIKGNEYSLGPLIDRGTIKFMHERSVRHSLKPAEDAQDFFLRSLTFWRRFLADKETRQLLKVFVEGKPFAANRVGMYKAHEMAGLPQVVMPKKDSDPISLVTRKSGVVYRSGK